ncbi:MAG TPA: hypothetical protein VFS43_34545 [Polyangiaceae bacterium]|nr:hypothetical protein [Polyangiaceae bacterium]
MRFAAAGEFHTCAQLDERIACWGLNAKGQLGHSVGAGGVASDRSPSFVTDENGSPRAMSSRQLALRAHSCALLDGGTVECWGGNRYGQLGRPDQLGSDVGDPVPRPVLDERGAPLGRVLAIAAGADHTCARFEPGQGPAGADVACWGRNDEGQLGNPSQGGPMSPGSPTPLPVVLGGPDGPPLLGVAQIGLGEDHACARLHGGQVYCWGSNEHGALARPEGYGTTDAQPFALPALDEFDEPVEGVVAMAVGYGVCVSRDEAHGGSVVCWGRKKLSLKGEPIEAGGSCPWAVRHDEATPLRGPKQIFAGGAHYCALMPDDTLRCWGNGDAGQLGRGSAVVPGGTATYYLLGDLALPVLDAQGSPLRDVAQVSLGAAHSCAQLSSSTQLLCWGANEPCGQAGYAAPPGAFTPIVPSPSPVQGLEPATP